MIDHPLLDCTVQLQFIVYFAIYFLAYLSSGGGGGDYSFNGVLVLSAPLSNPSQALSIKRREAGEG